mmetsp:Transcript_38375/g.80436  ORF Transcript_38375/g.80436 Transcript_38375/m.80436 type:complete len:283 (-) Transcript_38375:245-1093(-)|eukprot:CAMPEP_0172189324 /NCGR_PEP_ID=MMETSP1050-20130122/22457_1 /TAXON_ID=233186 /ORGANISM="Cryptomonas curvata, Strain CCAP979/52" /LENGTH=282 /DNA_ID=CAMNT_0012863999 /DNA_START=118 /DNA_END=966 /DNA_ORIENTATION=+
MAFFGDMDAEFANFDCLGYKASCNPEFEECEFISIGSEVSFSASALSSVDGAFQDGAFQDDQDCDDLPMPNRNERHKLVERQRRDKTRGLLRELQTVLPGVADNKQTPNINAILEETLEFLQAENEAKEHKACKDVLSMKVRDVKDLKKKSRIMSPFDDTSCRRYLFAFDYAPMGLVISSIDGRVLGANKSFQRWFRFDNGMDGSTIFSLTCPPDLAKTLKAASQLVAGEAPVIAISKQCIRGDGILSERLYVEMSCIRREGKPYAFLCEVRPADPRSFGAF